MIQPSLTALGAKQEQATPRGPRKAASPDPGNGASLVRSPVDRQPDPLLPLILRILCDVASAELTCGHRFMIVKEPHGNLSDLHVSAKSRVSRSNLPLSMIPIDASSTWRS